MEQMIEQMRDPSHIIQEAKYQNARDAVAWAWKIAQDKASNYQQMPKDADGKYVDEKELNASEYATKISAYAAGIIPMIEADLNRTLEVLNVGETKDNRIAA
jgi:hypothetical protein